MCSASFFLNHPTFINELFENAEKENKIKELSCKFEESQSKLDDIIDDMELELEKIEREKTRHAQNQLEFKERDLNILKKNHLNYVVEEINILRDNNQSWLVKLG